MHIHKCVKLKDYTTWGVGGKADAFVEVRTSEELVKAYKLTASYESIVLGRGSNVLVSDSGFRGIVIAAKNDCVCFDGGTVVADAGTSLSLLENMCFKRGIGGLEWAAGLPASVGGATVMNAGAFGKSIADIALWVETVDSAGKIRRYKNSEAGFDYRKSIFSSAKGEAVVKTAFSLCGQVDRQARLRHINFRKNNHPKGRSAGSVFKAVENSEKSAGWYIDNAGLKGLKIGGAEVSRVHANFIINTGGATATDISALIDIIKAEVFVKYTIKLNEEIKFVGDF